ncbi:MAG: hypothetical protein HZC45_05505 [Deltaproteobacteria bacterium]|nr:hypothetical protein [Deltaproteobacteria bacterium]
MKQFFTAFVIFAFFISATAIVLFLFFVDTSPVSKGEFIYTKTRLALFRHTGLNTLKEGDERLLYESSCARKCHSRDVVERTRHTAREWEAVIQRMRFVNKADVREKEGRVILKYLQKNFLSSTPTILSPEANKYLKQYLWRSDFGESDLYVDIIYTPVVYHTLTSGTGEALGYKVDEYAVFMVYLNTHQSKLLPFQMENLTILRDETGKEYKPISWKVTYESGDLHHREGVLVFPKVKTDKGFLEIVLKDLPGQKERLFRWDLPIPEMQRIRG